MTIVDQSWILLLVSLKLCAELGILSRTALWDYIEDAVALFIGCYEVAPETGSNFVLQNRNRPTVSPQCNSKLHQLSLTHSRPQCFRVWEWFLFSTCAEEPRSGILLTSYNHPKASKRCASDIISSLNQLLVVRVSMRPWLLIFKHIIEHSFPRKWTLRSVFERKENKTSLKK